MKEMILCMLLLAIIIGAANLIELPTSVGARLERQQRADAQDREDLALTHRDASVLLEHSSR